MLVDEKIIRSFVTRAEDIHLKRQNLDGQLAELYREARNQRLDCNAIKQIVRGRHHGSCGDDLLAEYRAIARNAPQQIEGDGLDAVLGPSA